MKRFGSFCFGLSHGRIETRTCYVLNEIESMHHILDVSYDEDRCKLLIQNMFNYLLNDKLLLEVIGNITTL